MKENIKNPYSEHKKILRLVRLYTNMADGTKIPMHTELIYLCNLRKTSIDSSSVFSLPVFISRKALKHFVESRRNELLKWHNSHTTNRYIEFIVLNVKNVLTLYDHITYDSNKNQASVSKSYLKFKKPNIKILIEQKDLRFEVVSMHFTKIKKPSQG